MRTAHDYRETLAAWQPTPANDNGLITSDSFTDLAARRAYVQRPQRKPEPALNLPTLERLSRSSPDAVPLWRFWRDLQAAPGDVFQLPEYATDYSTAGELKPEGSLLDEGHDAPANPGFGIEQDLEIRPTVDALQRAWESAPARRVSVHCVVRGGERFDVQSVIDPVVTIKGAMAYIGPLVFRNGEMVRWGTFGRGKPLDPVERLRAPKGSRQKPPLRDLRHLVRTDAPIAKGAGFLAGACHSTGRGGAPLECFADQQLERKAEEHSLRDALGAHAEILDLAISDSTAREIGESRGYSGKHAERRGIFLINEAFAALRALVGENLFAQGCVKRSLNCRANPYLYRRQQRCCTT
jgi:hypothetical protein